MDPQVVIGLLTVQEGSVYYSYRSSLGPTRSIDSYLHFLVGYDTSVGVVDNRVLMLKMLLDEGFALETEAGNKQICLNLGVQVCRLGRLVERLPGQLRPLELDIRPKSPNRLQQKPEDDLLSFFLQFHLQVGLCLTNCAVLAQKGQLTHVGSHSTQSVTLPKPLITMGSIVAQIQLSLFRLCSNSLLSINIWYPPFFSYRAYLSEKEDCTRPLLPTMLMLFTLDLLSSYRASRLISVLERNLGSLSKTLATSIETFPLPTKTTSLIPWRWTLGECGNELYQQISFLAGKSSYPRVLSSAAPKAQMTPEQFFLSWANISPSTNVFPKYLNSGQLFTSASLFSAFLIDAWSGATPYLSSPNGVSYFSQICTIGWQGCLLNNLAMQNPAGPPPIIAKEYLLIFQLIMTYNQAQEGTRPNMMYTSSSKGNLYSKSPMLPSQSIPLQKMNFHNPYGLREEVNTTREQKDVMSKSTFMKSDNQMDNFLKDVKEKFFKIQRRLVQHQQQLSQLKSRQSNSSTMDTSGMNFSSDTEYKLQNKIYQEIDKVKHQINAQYLRKDALDFTLNRFQLDCFDKLVGKKELQNKIQEIKDKTNHELMRVFDAMKIEMENSISQVHDVNRVVFSRIEKDMSEMKALIDEQRFHAQKLNHQILQQQQPLFPGAKKCFGGVKLLKYQETLERMGTGAAEQVVLNECIYYLDRDGYLLDKNGFYLLNKADQQIQLDQRHLTTLKKHNLLF